MNVQNISFKGVYRVNSGYATKVMGVEISDPVKFNVPDNSGTNTLYKLANPNNANEDIILVQKGALQGCISMNHPSLILTNDAEGNDATKYLNFKNNFEAKVLGLYDKTTDQLKKMLKRKEVKSCLIEAQKDPFSSANPFKDGLIKEITGNLYAEMGPKEDILYEGLLKRVKVFPSKVIQDFPQLVFSLMENVSKKV